MPHSYTQSWTDDAENKLIELSMNADLWRGEERRDRSEKVWWVSHKFTQIFSPSGLLKTRPASERHSSSPLGISELVETDRMNRLLRIDNLAMHMIDKLSWWLHTSRSTPCSPWGYIWQRSRERKKVTYCLHWAISLSFSQPLSGFLSIQILSHCTLNQTHHLHEPDMLSRHQKPLMKYGVYLILLPPLQVFVPHTLCSWGVALLPCSEHKAMQNVGTCHAII